MGDNINNPIIYIYTPDKFYESTHTINPKLTVIAADLKPNEEEILVEREETMRKLQAEQSLQVFGYCSQFRARFTKQELDFGLSPINSQQVLILGLINDHNEELEFSFVGDSKLFRVKPNKGTVKKKGSRELKVIFKNAIPANYFQRLFCVVKGHWLLSVDCMGAVKDYLKTPFPLHLIITPPRKLLKENDHSQANKGNPIPKHKYLTW